MEVRNRKRGQAYSSKYAFFEIKKIKKSKSKIIFPAKRSVDKNEGKHIELINEFDWDCASIARKKMEKLKEHDPGEEKILREVF